MLDEKTSETDLLEVIEELRGRLAEAEQALESIRSGEVDALVISGDEGEQIFTLQGADHPYRVMVETINEGAVTLSEDGVVLYANARLASMLNAPLESILGSYFLMYVAEEDKKTFEALLAQGEEDRSRGEVVLHRLDRVHIPVLLSLSSLKSSDLEGICLIVTDLTEQKIGEKALRESWSMFEWLFESMPDATITVDKDGSIKRLNQKALEQFAFSLEELVGQPIDLLLPEPYRQELADARATILAESSWDSASCAAETFALRKGSEEFPVEVTLSSLRHAADPEVIFVMRDITQRKQIESELAEVRGRVIDSIEAERIRLSQELHDGPIQELYGIFYQLKSVRAEIARAISHERPLLSDLSRVQENIQQVVNRLRTFCGELRPAALAQFGLEKSIRSHASKFQHDHPETHLTLELQSDGQLLPETTRLTLYRIYQQSLSNVLRHAQATQVAVRFHYDAGTAYLRIQDNGRGFVVPESWVDLVRQGHLGLAGSAERASAIGGKFMVISAPGDGTTVEVALPLFKYGEFIEEAPII